MNMEYQTLAALLEQVLENQARILARLDDDAIGQAARRYEAAMAVVHGGEYA